MATGGDKPTPLDADVDMADLASLDAPAAPSAAAAGAPRFRPKAKGKLKPKPEVPKPKPVDVPKPEPEPVSLPEPEPEPEAARAPPPRDDRVDAMEVDGAVDAAALGEGAAAAEEEEQDFVVREIDVYFSPRPFDDDDAKIMSSGTRLYHFFFVLSTAWGM